MDQMWDIKDNGMHSLIGLEWRQRKKQLVLDELGIEHSSFGMEINSISKVILGV